MVEQRSDERLLEQWVVGYLDDPEYIAGELASDVTDEALGILEKRHLTQSWLAEQMGVSRQSVSRMFNAAPNLTLLSIARIGTALAVKPRVILDSNAWYIQPINDGFDFEKFEAQRVEHAYTERNRNRTSNDDWSYTGITVGTAGTADVGVE